MGYLLNAVVCTQGNVFVCTQNNSTEITKKQKRDFCSFEIFKIEDWVVVVVSIVHHTGT